MKCVVVVVVVVGFLFIWKIPHGHRLQLLNVVNILVFRLFLIVTLTDIVKFLQFKLALKPFGVEVTFVINNLSFHYFNLFWLLTSNLTEVQSNFTILALH